MYHDGFLGAVGTANSSGSRARHPDVEVETVLAERTLGVPHVHADKVAVCLVDQLHARVAHRRREVRLCTRRATNDL